MQDQLFEYFRNLLNDTLKNVAIFIIALIVVLVILSIIFFWIEWKGR